ncbi:hypothetical protein ZHAS_00021831 [Anopheles sinensis]|uniref:Uncharacterized protein n=1 Tax=Anopheles sinensis TaxID=74873 RepID=A0A084WTP9_ANOSI|nr:hypothetical protein ZHAS_00021831 [Anopheles sinensis]
MIQDDAHDDKDGMVYGRQMNGNEKAERERIKEKRLPIPYRYHGAYHLAEIDERLRYGMGTVSGKETAVWKPIVRSFPDGPNSISGNIIFRLPVLAPSILLVR